MERTKLPSHQVAPAAKHMSESKKNKEMNCPNNPQNHEKKINHCSNSLVTNFLFFGGGAGRAVYYEAIDN